jgi:hypothetical protein
VPGVYEVYYLPDDASNLFVPCDAAFHLHVSRSPNLRAKQCSCEQRSRFKS